MEERDKAVADFMYDVQNDILPGLWDFHESISKIEGFPEKLLVDYTWLCKRLRWSFEHTANELNGQE